MVNAGGWDQDSAALLEACEVAGEAPIGEAPIDEEQPFPFSVTTCIASAYRDGSWDTCGNGEHGEAGGEHGEAGRWLYLS